MPLGDGFGPSGCPSFRSNISVNGKGLFLLVGNANVLALFSEYGINSYCPSALRHPCLPNSNIGMGRVMVNAKVIDMQCRSGSRGSARAWRLRARSRGSLTSGHC
jgi:hypothetical protein